MKETIMGYDGSPRVTMLQNLTSQYCIFHMEAMLALDITSTRLGLGWLIFSLEIYFFPSLPFFYRLIASMDI